MDQYFKDDEPATISGTFNVTKDLLIPNDSDEDLDEFEQETAPVDFLFATRVDNYYRVIPGLLSDKIEVFIAPEVDLSQKFFVADPKISVIGKIEALSAEDIYIGGEHPAAIQEEAFLTIVAQFPNSYERRLYSDARVTAVLSQYFSSVQDRTPMLNSYLNKKATKRGENVLKTFQESERLKYEALYAKLVRMLKDENGYNEHQWQEEILQIIRLLFPKYIFAFKSVPIAPGVSSDLKGKQLDILLVDSNGNVDVVEIKKPFDNAIVTSNYYRDNYIPLRELSGTVMQLEKYIYYLNRWAEGGEKLLTARYKEELPAGFEINITNPGGLIIMGRENKLNPAQKRDFEVIKRKYKNVVDIITYDNLLARLKFTIEQIAKL